MIAKRFIDEEWRDDDGYWIALRNGVCEFGNPQCHTIHENTKAEAHARGIQPCACKECKPTGGQGNE